MIFKSRQVNLDPHPWFESATGSRFATQEAYFSGDPRTLDPRPEFEPTRDPKPYEWEGYRYRPEQRALFPNQPCNWSPRREQYDTPVNPILVDIRRYRAERATMNNPKDWAHVLRRFENACGSAQTPLSNAYTKNYTPEQIAHARKVLTRLAALS